MHSRFLKPIVLSAIATLLLVSGVVVPASAQTTQCTAITKTPTVISRPGHYCLTKDLRFTPLAGTAIDVRVGNVVLDMNGYYLRGDVSEDNLAFGIRVRNKPNVRIANGVLVLLPTKKGSRFSTWAFIRACKIVARQFSA